MSTKPNFVEIAPATAATTVETVIKHWVTLVKAHEKLLLAIILSVVLFHFGNKTYDAYGNYLAHKQSETNLQIATQSASNVTLQKQIDSLTATVASQSKIDDAKISAAKQTLVIRRQTDAAMPTPELASRIANLLQVKPEEVTAAILPDHLDLDSSAAHAVANDLEEIPALQTQLVATQDKLTGCTSVVALSTQQITGLNLSLALEQKGRTEDAKVAAVKQRKSFLRGFKYGFGTGVVVTVAAIAAVKTALHI